MTDYTIYGLYDSSEGDSYENVRYVGQTTQKISDRVQAHRRASRAPSNQWVTRWIKSIGEENLGYLVIETGEFVSNGHLDGREILHISEALNNGLELTNLTEGGRGCRGYVWSEDLVAKRSKEGNSFYGKTHTEETRKFLSDKASERWKDEEFSAKQRELFINREKIQKIWEGGENHPFWGKQHKDSTKTLISEAGKRLWENPTPEMQERAKQAGLKASHTRWHVNRGKTVSTCSHCSYRENST